LKGLIEERAKLTLEREEFRQISDQLYARGKDFKN
jgi:hypothetical protein